MILRFLTVDPTLESKTIYTPWAVLVVFALGWALAQARTPIQRSVVVGLAIFTLVGYSDNWTRVAVIAIGIGLLAAMPVVRVPTVLVRITVPIASASLYIYLTHWQVYPLFGEYEVLALLGSLLAGIVMWKGTMWIGAQLEIASWAGKLSPDRTVVASGAVSIDLRQVDTEQDGSHQVEVPVKRSAFA
jgi:hypothetical protein